MQLADESLENIAGHPALMVVSWRGCPARTGVFVEALKRKVFFPLLPLPLFLRLALALNFNLIICVIHFPLNALLQSVVFPVEIGQLGVSSGEPLV